MSPRDFSRLRPGPRTRESGCSPPPRPRFHGRVARIREPRRADGQADHLLHVRLPLRHRRDARGERDPLHQGQPPPPGQQGRAVRQGQRRDHEAEEPGEADAAAGQEGRYRARRRSLRADQLGAGARAPDRAPPEDPRDRPEEARLLHRARPDAGADGVLGDAVRHDQLGRPRRLLLGQHGRGRALHDRAVVLGVRRPGLGPGEVLHALGRGRGPRLEPDQDRAREAQASRREVRRDQPRPHRLPGDRRRVDRRAPRHRRAARAVVRARAPEERAVRRRLPRPLHELDAARHRRARDIPSRHAPARRRRAPGGLGHGDGRAGFLARRRARGQRHRAGTVRRVDDGWRRGQASAFAAWRTRTATRRVAGRRTARRAVAARHRACACAPS